MKKIFLSAIAALTGICLAVAVHCSFMIVEEQGSAMLPDIEPGQRVVLCLLVKDSDIQVGDIVAYEAPYYTVEGQNGILLRRVSEVMPEDVVVSCDAKMTQQEDVKISKDAILGRAIVY